MLYLMVLHVDTYMQKQKELVIFLNPSSIRSLGGAEENEEIIVEEEILESEVVEELIEELIPEQEFEEEQPKFTIIDMPNYESSQTVVLSFTDNKTIYKQSFQNLNFNNPAKLDLVLQVNITEINNLILCIKLNIKDICLYQIDKNGQYSVIMQNSLIQNNTVYYQLLQNVDSLKINLPHKLQAVNQVEFSQSISLLNSTPDKPQDIENNNNTSITVIIAITVSIIAVLAFIIIITTVVCLKKQKRNNQLINKQNLKINQLKLKLSQTDGSHSNILAQESTVKTQTNCDIGSPQQQLKQKVTIIKQKISQLRLNSNISNKPGSSLRPVRADGAKSDLSVKELNTEQNPMQVKKIKTNLKTKINFNSIKDKVESRISSRSSDNQKQNTQLQQNVHKLKDMLGEYINKQDEKLTKPVRRTKNASQLSQQNISDQNIDQEKIRSEGSNVSENNINTSEIRI